MHPVRRAVHAAVSGALLALGLAACTPGNEPSPAPSSSAPERMFDSDEEALAAAEEALDEFWRLKNLIMQEGGSNPERMAPVVIPDRLAAEVEAAAEFSDDGWSQIGEISYEVVQLQQHYVGAAAEMVIVMQCVDFSHRTIVQSDGTLVDLSNVPPRRLFQTTLEVDDDHLVIKESEAWPDVVC